MKIENTGMPQYPAKMPDNALGQSAMAIKINETPDQIMNSAVKMVYEATSASGRLVNAIAGAVPGMGGETNPQEYPTSDEAFIDRHRVAMREIISLCSVIINEANRANERLGN